MKALLTLTAMLLGHHYLTAPAMSIEPLKRFVRCMGFGLAARTGLAALGLWIWLRGGAGPSSTASPLFIAVRWGMGLAGPAVATYMTHETVRIRSTQSATGILYVVVIVSFLGELTSQLLVEKTGCVL